MTDYAYIDRSVNEIAHRIITASREAGLKSAPTLIAATKYASDGEFLHLVRQCGVADVGENRVQQLIAHRELLTPEERDRIRFHFIGHLQTNKVKHLIGSTVLIHSLDSEELAREVEKQSAKHDTVTRVLVEVNGASEENKTGVLPGDVAEFCLSLRQFPHIDHVGFMTMGPKFEKKDDYSNYFLETYQLVLDIWREKLHNIKEPVISMGMSDSFETAIKCGANCVRIGRALFGR